MHTVPEKFRIQPGIPEGFKVTTLGSGSPGQDLRKSSPCTMVQYKDKYFVCDLGNGAMNQMLKAGINPPDVVNVFLTHLHADHSSDYPYFLIIGHHDGRKRVNLAGPPKVKHFHDTIVNELYGDYVKYFENLGFNMDGLTTNINIRPIEDRDSFELDGVTISTIRVPHTIHSLSYKFEAGGQRVVVSGDLMHSESFVEFAMDTDILVMDANQTPAWHLASMHPDFEKRLEKSHIRIAELAEVARKTNAKKLVLTHLTRGTYIGELVSQVCKIYDGEIVVAFDLLEIFPGIKTGY
ncbi:MAG: MBL fold metallo-hydrolase [Defluviitaleaceae bacterium]|nr:MBL fold metallo-hydrolase [Defluviitaleaceae bacterium]